MLYNADMLQSTKHYEAQMTLPRRNLIVFDIETAIDTEMAKSFLGLDPSTTDEEAEAKLTEYHLNITDGKNGFARQPFHKVVAIAFLHAEIGYDNGQEHYNLLDLRAGGKLEFAEKELIQSFYSYLSTMKPRFVSFNGRTFDMPVLKYRAMRHGIDAAWMYKDGDKWNNYQSRYSADWHCDLLDVLSDYGASARVKMNEVCGLLSLPGKLEIDGSKVGEMYKNGQLKEIRDYCELDVANTYLIYLATMHHTGTLSKAAFESAKQDLVYYMQEHSESKQHFGEFLSNM